jgi:copper chaperone CopZ
MGKLITHTYHLAGMNCGDCLATVKNKLPEVPIVASVNLDLGKKQAKIISSDAIKIENL